jgi:hypothetical protein
MSCDIVFQKMLGLQTHLTKKKKKNYKLMWHNMIEVSQNLNLSHIQSYCATSVCKMYL